MHYFFVMPVNLISRQKPIDNNSTEIPTRNNLSYVTGSRSRSQALQETETDASATAADYSRIGPSYETIDSSGPRRQRTGAAAERNVGRNQNSARLSERYEFSESHLAMISAGAAGGPGGGEAAVHMDYEVPVQSGEHEEYSHLQH